MPRAAFDQADTFRGCPGNTLLLDMIPPTNGLLTFTTRNLSRFSVASSKVPFQNILSLAGVTYQPHQSSYKVYRNISF